LAEKAATDGSEDTPDPLLGGVACCAADGGAGAACGRTSAATFMYGDSGNVPPDDAVAADSGRPVAPGAAGVEAAIAAPSGRVPWPLQ